MMRFKAFMFVALAAGAAPSGAASLIANGDFETPDIATYLFVSQGSTAITGWTAAALPGSAPGTDVQLTDNDGFSALGVVASSGRQFMDLTGNVGRGGGLVSDGFATSLGATYRVGFDVGAFFVGGSNYGNAIVDLYVDSVYAQSFLNVQNLTSAGSDWLRFSYDFVGTGNSMTIGMFSSLSVASSNLAVGLDNVSVDLAVTAVPEPATWAMMIGGFALAGAGMRRGKTRSALRFA